MSDEQPIEWLVFAEDWGGHPSTAQHLIAHLPAHDRVLWVDSLGMRAPRLSRLDVDRVVGRLAKAVRGALAGAGGGPVHDAPTVAGTRAPDLVVRPVFVPFHDEAAAVALNRSLLATMVGRAARQLGLDAPVLVTTNPVLANYVDRLRHRAVVYLRMDDYAALPGVDASLVEATEPALIARADLVVVPSKQLVPTRIATDVTRVLDMLVLPQGVDVARFTAVPLDPPETQTIGYWGAIGEWLDFGLIADAAQARPGYTFELRGTAREVPEVMRALDDLTRLPNVRVVPAVPHYELAAAAAHWRGAWAPFRRGTYHEHGSPLKLREYLAAGFPTAGVPIPEVLELGGITPIDDVGDVVTWLDGPVALDTREARAERRNRMAGEGWAGRAARLRAEVERLLQRDE